MLVTAFGMFAIPFSKTALLLTALMSSIGVSMGFLDTGAVNLTVFIFKIVNTYLLHTVQEVVVSECL